MKKKAEILDESQMNFLTGLVSVCGLSVSDAIATARYNDRLGADVSDSAVLKLLKKRKQYLFNFQKSLTDTTV